MTLTVGVLWLLFISVGFSCFWLVCKAFGCVGQRGISSRFLEFVVVGNLGPLYCFPPVHVLSNCPAASLNCCMFQRSCWNWCLVLFGLWSTRGKRNPPGLRIFRSQTFLHQWPNRSENLRPPTVPPRRTMAREEQASLLETLLILALIHLLFEHTAVPIR